MVCPSAEKNYKLCRISQIAEEYQLIKDAAAQKGAETGTDGRANYLAERDAFIANRIDKTLKDGETGVLFLGMLHKVDEKLTPDIVIDYLIYHLPFKEAVSKKKNCNSSPEEKDLTR